MSDRPEKIVPEKFANRNIYSISRLNAFHNCRYSYFRNYILKDRGKNNIYGILGEFIHSKLEELEVGAITNDEAVHQFDAKLLECEILGWKFPTEKVKTNFTESIRLYLKSHKPINAKKILIEKEFYTEVEGCVLLGYIDVIAWLHNGEVHIYDYKTSTKFAKKDLDHHALQLILYSIAIEQEYGIKVNAIKWNMIKYCIIRWMGATKPREMFVQRNELIKSLRSELLKDLSKEGKTDIEIEILLEESEKLNTFELFSDTIKNKYTIEDAYVEYACDDKAKKMLKDFVVETVSEIEAMPSNQSMWRGREITTKDNFYCSQLCGHKASCPYYMQFIENNPELFEKPEQEDDLIAKIFG